MRGLVFLLLAPWWLYLAAAVGGYFLTEHTYQSTLDTQADMRVALEAGAPPVVDLSDFDPREDVARFGEINVSGWINFEHNYHLVLTKNGTAKKDRYMYVLFGAGDDEAATEARGALLLTESEKDHFVESSGEFLDLDGFLTSGRMSYVFNGRVGYAGEFDDLLDSALRDEQLTKARNFVLVEPYWKGREAALTPTKDPDAGRQTGYRIVGALLAIGLFKLLWSLRKGKVRLGARPARDPFSASPIADGKGDARAKAGSQPTARPVSALTDEPHSAVAPGPPLDRIQRQNARAQREASIRPVPDPAQRPQEATNAGSLIDRLAGMSQGTNVLFAVVAVIVFTNLDNPNILGVLFSVIAMFVMYGFIATKVFASVKQAGSEIAGAVRGGPPRHPNMRDDPFARLNRDRQG